MHSLRLAVPIVAAVATVACADDSRRGGMTAPIEILKAGAFTAASVVLAPGDILVEQDGTLMRVDPTTLARTDYPLGILTNCSTKGLALSPAGGLFVSSNPHSGCGEASAGVYRIDTNTGAETLVSSGGLLTANVFGLAVASSGDLFVAVRSGVSGSIVRVNSQTGAQSLVSSAFVQPVAIAIAITGQLFVTDLGDQSVSRVDPTTGTKTVVSAGGVLAGIQNAGGVVFGLDGQLYVASVDLDPDVETGLIARIDLTTGMQTIVSYGQLLVAGSTGVTGMATESNGNLIVIDRRSSYGVIRVDPTSGQQTGLDIGAAPIDGIAVVPSSPYGFLGLFEPYRPPDQKQFKAGSVIPLSWQYTRDAMVINSSENQPTLTVNGPVTCGIVSDGDPVTINAAGISGFQYDAITNTWRFNWKTAKGTSGCYNVAIDQNALGVSRSFPIKIAK